MRCKECRKESAGVGKPAVPPVLPAVVALAGCVGGLWYLTLSQNPANPMPSWSPAVGWSVALGSLVAAAALAWMGMVRRRCPACGSRQMLDAMEEDSLIASERLAAQEAAAAAARAEEGSKASAQIEQELRMQIEAELRSTHDKEIADRLSALEKGLRLSIEQDLRGRLARELRPQVEHDVRRIVEKELRAKLEDELRASQARIEAKLRLEIEKQQGMTLPAAESSLPKIEDGHPSSAVTPTPVSPPSAAVTPTPVSRPSAMVTPTPVSRPAASVTHTPGPVIKRAKPALPHAKPDTAPLSLRSSKAPVGSSAEEAKENSPSTKPPLADEHERARRRARVILSDMSLYHREALLKAAHADDAKAELGALWRDAVTSYKEVAVSNSDSATSYLEDELERQLSQLRKA